jgi:hypothetical protein
LNFNQQQPRGQMMIYQNPPPSTITVQQQDMNTFANSNNYPSTVAPQQVTMNRFNVPRGNMMMTMGGNGNVGGNVDSGNMIAGSSNFQQPPRFSRPQQW